MEQEVMTMAKLSTIRLPMSEVMRNQTLQLTVEWDLPARARMRAGIWLIRLAARVIGCNVDVTVETKGRVRESVVTHEPLTGGTVTHRRAIG
jgi:hypothetical protein